MILTTLACWSKIHNWNVPTWFILKEMLLNIPNNFLIRLINFQQVSILLITLSKIIKNNTTNRRPPLSFTFLNKNTNSSNCICKQITITSNKSYACDHRLFRKKMLWSFLELIYHFIDINCMNFANVSDLNNIASLWKLVSKVVIVSKVVVRLRFAFL